MECIESTNTETVDPLPHVSTTSCLTSSPLSVTPADCSLPMSNETCSIRAQRTAASFLITFKEQYNLKVQSILLLELSVAPTVVMSYHWCKWCKWSCSWIWCHQHQTSLQTEYKQSKFYREVFGLVVSIVFISVYQWRVYQWRDIEFGFCRNLLEEVVLNS